MDRQILNFTANEQVLTVDEPIRISTNKVNYIEAHFALGTNWSGYDSVRAVWFNDYQTISTVLDSQGVCRVPFEVMKRKGQVKVDLVGSISEGDVLTDRLTSYPVVAVIVDCVAPITGAETSPITPSQFEQFVANVRADADRAEAGAEAAETSAGESEASATASAQSATASANSASQAQTYSQNAQNYAISAENAKDDAEEARDKILGMRATANTLAEGSDATASYSDGLLTLGIPRGDKGEKGDKGDTGATPNLSIGTVETLPPTGSSEVTITGTAENPVLNFKLVKGDTGEVTQAELDEAVTDLKSDISVVYGYFDEIKHSSDYDANSFIDTGHPAGYTVNTTPSSYSGWACLVLPCKEGDKFVISGRGSTSDSRLWCFTDEDKKIISNYAYSDTVTNLALTASADGYLILNTDMNVPYLAVIKGTIDEDFASIKSDLEQRLPTESKDFDKLITTEDIISFATVGKLNDRNGIVTDSGTAYKTSDYIDLDGVTGIYRTGTTTMFTLWTYCFYDNNKTFLGSEEDTTDYTIVAYNGKQVTWLDLSNYPTAKYVRISWQLSRPYEYYVVSQIPCYRYDVPHITITDIEPLKFYGKSIVNFGDSIFGNFRDTDTTTDKSISKMIAEATGATVYNAGFGGCRMGVHSSFWDAFSMHSLADSIASGSWTVQDNALVSGSGTLPSYFSDVVTMLKSLDFSEIDYITIGYGVNDYTGNAFINGNEATFSNVWDYYKGALRYSISTILTAFPNIKIIVITPCWMWFPDGNGAYDYSSDDAEAINTRGYKLIDYVNACETVCNEYHVPCINTYNELGFNQFSYTAYFYVKGVDGATASDGTHPKQSGRQLRADRIVGQMESLY